MLDASKCGDLGRCGCFRLGKVAGVSLPADPAAFVSAAARGINERDLDATAGVYSENARLESLTDGAREVHDGATSIRSAWAGYLAAMDNRGFRLSKSLLGASNDVLVNEWTGTLGGRTEAYGIEYWRFDGEGKVSHHRMLSLLNVKPSTSLLQRLRLFLSYPLTAISFLRATRRSRA
jgi:hypothetical protein